jgi:uncharacterized RDD family membrane protein YckC
MNYAGFWRRFGAFWIDFAAMTPIIAIVLYGTNHSRLFNLWWFLPGAAFGLWFSVYLVMRFGGTPGKLLLGTRVVMSNGLPVTPRAALIRHSVAFVLGLITSLGLCLGALALTDDQYLAMSLTDKNIAITRSAPGWYGASNIAMQAWGWAEMLTVLFNKKRRAVHDFMAGTAVVRVR